MPTKQPELKSCPFCGGEAMAWDYSTESDTWQVTCHSKDPNCVVTVYSSDSQDAAIAAWNKRTPVPASGASEMWMPVAVNDLTYHMGKQSYMLGGQPIDMLDLPSHLRLCRSTPVPALPQALVMPPDRFGTVVIWPQGEVQERTFAARIEVFKSREIDLEPGIRWGGTHIDHIDHTRRWARAMLVACDIAEGMRQRPAAQTQDDEVTNG